MKLRVPVSDLYIPRISLPIWLQQSRQTDPGNIKIAHRYMNVEIGRHNIIILFRNNEGRAVSFLGIHKSEPDIYIGFSPALHLQCTMSSQKAVKKGSREVLRVLLIFKEVAAFMWTISLTYTPPPLFQLLSADIHTEPASGVLDR
jgi:hypothetical protein